MTQAKTVQAMTIGGLAEVLLKKGLGADETLKGILRVFPGARTTKKCVYFYASRLGIRLRQGAVADQAQLKKLLKEVA